jgi:hypothetical protein
MTTTTEPAGRVAGRRGVWAAGLFVAAGAGIATAHGLYQVAAAAKVPAPIAWLYPLITDGLALVGYATTSRLAAGGGRRYAATIVVLAAGLSGLAQAVYLAGGIAHATVASVGLRFGVGAWPAIAAALTAHLLHLIGAGSPRTAGPALTPTRQQSTPTPQAPDPATVQPTHSRDVQPYNPAPASASNVTAVQRPRTSGPLDASAVQPARTTTTGQHGPADADGGRSVLAGRGSARERARTAARAHLARYSRLPTVTELCAAAQVARGTAGTVLKTLRAERPALHLVNANLEQETDR